MSAIASATRLDLKKYARLLVRALPKAIETEKENERALAEIEKLIDKGKARSSEENALLGLLLNLVEKFEAEHYPIPDAPPHEVIRHLMEEHDLRPRDLAPIVGSRGYASDLINGKREISRAMAKKLAEFFHVSPEVFF
jgi:HTH-type transcriptional regulator/antitoxin HigA